MGVVVALARIGYRLVGPGPEFSYRHRLLILSAWDEARRVSSQRQSRQALDRDVGDALDPVLAQRGLAMYLASVLSHRPGDSTAPITGGQWSDDSPGKSGFISR